MTNKPKTKNQLNLKTPLSPSCDERVGEEEESVGFLFLLKRKVSFVGIQVVYGLGSVLVLLINSPFTICTFINRQEQWIQRRRRQEEEEEEEEHGLHGLTTTYQSLCHQRDPSTYYYDDDDKQLY